MTEPIDVSCGVFVEVDPETARWIVRRHTPLDVHNWVDTSSLNSTEDEYMCAGCGITKTEPRTHWPLYPYR